MATVTGMDMAMAMRHRFGFDRCGFVLAGISLGLSALPVAAAEWANIRHQEDYPHDDEAFVADWQVELDLLMAAVRAEDKAETAVLAQQFLDQRAARRGRPA